jgi:hypothetical protein
MRLKALATSLLVVGMVACDETLSLSPTSEVREEDAIVDAGSARAALAGAYDALQDGSYYGGEFLFYADLLSEDVEHTGTFSDYAATDANRVVPDNESLLGIWESIYATVNVANQLIFRVPNVPGMTQAERDDIMGQAHFLRALSYHNLVKLWGDIPMPLTPINAEAAANLTKSTVTEVYTQIISDLTQAEALIGNASDTRKATADAVVALRSRVMLHQSNWQGVIDAANSLEANYALAANYEDLFTPDGQDTPEDIFRVSFTPVEFNNVGFFYISRSFGGRWEVAPTVNLIDAYGISSDPAYDPDTTSLDSSFNPADSRAFWNIAFDSRARNFGGKIPTPIGAEDIHVIRFGEVILNKAEALAQRNGAGDLVLAINEVNRIRARAGAGTPAISPVGLSQTQVLDRIYRERRLELAMEGFAWPDLVRTGRAQSVLGATIVLAHELRMPIPQAEVDVMVTPNFQNPGY